MIRRLLAVSAIAICAAVIPATAASAATPKIEITKVYVNSPGSDTRSATSLNAEYIRLKNTSTTSVSLKGWTVRDRSSHVYTFGTFTLKAGASVTLHTGHGTNTSSNVYWNSGNYIWNNDGDKAYVRKPSTSTNEDTCTWATVASYKNCA
jgi:lamin tail-like protein